MGLLSSGHKNTRKTPLSVDAVMALRPQKSPSPVSFETPNSRGLISLEFYDISLPPCQKSHVNPATTTVLRCFVYRPPQSAANISTVNPRNAGSRDSGAENDVIERSNPRCGQASEATDHQINETVPPSCVGVYCWQSNCWQSHFLNCCQLRKKGNSHWKPGQTGRLNNGPLGISFCVFRAFRGHSFTATDPERRNTRKRKPGY